MPPVPKPAADRVMARTRLTEDGCIEFMGAKTARGYGVVQLGRGVGTDKAHRVVYAAQVGPIPYGMTLDHLCGNPACVNVDHLEPVTRAENTRRQWAAGRGNAGSAERAKTHCPRGHAYDEANTAHRGGRRHCRACQRERAAQARAASSHRSG